MLRHQALLTCAQLHASYQRFLVGFGSGAKAARHRLLNWGRSSTSQKQLWIGSAQVWWLRRACMLRHQAVLTCAQLHASYQRFLVDFGSGAKAARHRLLNWAAFKHFPETAMDWKCPVWWLRRACMLRHLALLTCAQLHALYQRFLVDFGSGAKAGQQTLMSC